MDKEKEAIQRQRDPLLKNRRCRRQGSGSRYAHTEKVWEEVESESENRFMDFATSAEAIILVLPSPLRPEGSSNSAVFNLIFIIPRR